MNPWLLGFLGWCALGAIIMLWYWYEKERIILHKKLAMSVVELLFGPVLWPLAAASAWIWRRSTEARIANMRRIGTPMCRRHGYVLLKCEHWHESFCSGCSPTVCPRCGGEPFLSPRYLGMTPEGEPLHEYQPIYAREI
jgi:hypothetical protein